MTQGRYGDPHYSGLTDAEKAFLNTIAAKESAGNYNVRFTPRGAATFDSYEQHPRIFEPTGDGRQSSAAGRYQITATTWEEQRYANIHGGDFSPENQDRVALQLAKDRYKAATGKDLSAELEQNGMTPEIVTVLSPTWAALKVGRKGHIDTYNSEFERISGQPAPVGPPQELPEITSNGPSRDSQTSSGESVAEDSSGSGEGIVVNWQENILSIYENPTYYLKLFSAPEMDEDTFIDVDPVGAKYKNVKKIVIAESAVTGINIESLEITTVVSPNQTTKLVQAVEIRMRVFEPMGMTLYNKLGTAAASLGNFNYQKTPYYLEIKFLGYDESGNPKEKIGPPPTDQKVWIYKVSITDIKSEFTQAGSVYDITMVQYNDYASLTSFATLEASFNPEGVSTIGEIIEQYRQSKEESDIAQYGYVRNNYDIKFLPLNNEMADINLGALNVSPDPTTWTVTIGKPEEPNQNASPTTADTKNFSFAKGQNVASLVEDLFACSKEGQALTRRSKQEGVISDEFEYVIVPYIIPMVSIRKDRTYDILVEDYNRNITFHVAPFLTTRGVMSPDQQKPLKERKVSANKEKLKIRVDTGKLEKRYDYLFTGLNTEVLNMDLKFDMLYKATIPAFSGNNTISAQSKNEIITEEQRTTEENSAAFSTLKNTQSEINNLENRVKSITNSLNSTEDERKSQLLDRQLTETQQELAAKRAALPELQADADRTARAATEAREARLAANRRDFSGDIYVEDLDQARSADYPAVTIDVSTKEGSIENRGPESKSPQGQSVTAALLNQLKEPSMIEINITIRGDPYWLGVTHCEQDYLSITLNSGKGVAEFNTGDMNFVLKFLMPAGVDELSGDPILKVEETFTGVYLVKKITHYFNKGSFTQTIEAVRDINIDISMIANI